jgi:hypothetical protein
MADRGRRYGTTNRGEKGPRGPGAHPEFAGEVNGAGGELAATELTAEELSFR